MPQVERRGPNRMTDAQYKAWQKTPRPGGNTRISTASDKLFNDTFSKLSADKLEYVKELKAQPRSIGTKIGTGIDSAIASGGRLAGKVANLPGARVVGKAMGRLAVPLMVAQAAYDVGRTAYEGGKAIQANRQAEHEKDQSENRYGTAERATTTRRSSQAIKNDWSSPKDYVSKRPSTNDFGW